MPVVSRTARIDAQSDRVFAYVDNIRNIARHMSERGSVPMMGAKLDLEIVTPEATGIGAIYRYSGRVMGLTIDFCETVTQYKPGREKVWRTIDQPRLLIMDGYEIRVMVERVGAASSKLTMSIDYKLPGSRFLRLLGHLLAPNYARLCLDSMLRGMAYELERNQSSHDTAGSNWPQALRRYVLASGALHLSWEIAQLPLYTIWAESIGRQAFAVLHCTVGDLMIAGLSLLLALAFIGNAGWPRTGMKPVWLLILLFGAGYTVYSEWLNVNVRGSWAYSPLMPTLPVTGTGIATILQWLVVPTAAMSIAVRRPPWIDNEIPRQ